MDFGKLDTREKGEEGMWMTVRHPGTYDEIEGTRIQLRSVDSHAFRKSVSLAAARAARSRDIDFNKPEEVMAQAQRGEKTSIEHLAAVTVGWENIELDGEELEFSKENALVLYERFPWLREQVQIFISDRANYLGND